ncbi:hypothetical protein SLS55_007281 [Diplodia seriata]|uniref:BTB domain-containing protein n=1 Tax=Diplodia seriata TaxID=420778 RepID=A0ABR3CC46_9PEZI
MSAMLKDIPDGETAPLGFLVTLRRQIKDRDGHVYNVHKIVVCSQSDFFANAFKENIFKESKDNLIHLPDDDPAAVRAMLQFMYTGTYDNPVFFGSVDAMLLLHLHVYLLADKYAVGSALVPAAHNNPNNAVHAVYADVARKNTLAGMAATRLRDDLLALWPLVQPVFPRLVKAVYDATAAAGGGGSHDMIRGDIAMVAAKHVGVFVGDDEDEGEGKSEGGIEAALRAGFVGGGVEEEDGEQGEGEGEGEGEQDVLTAFARDLIRILARERDELKAKCSRYAGAAFAAAAVGAGGSEDGGESD